MRLASGTILLLTLGALALAPSPARADEAEPAEEPAAPRFHTDAWGTTSEQALEGALVKAQVHLANYLRTQEIERVPSLETIRDRMVTGTNVSQPEVLPSPLYERMVKVTVVGEITPKQVRELRGRDRMEAGGRVLGGAVALCLLAALFFRLDDYTRGYLTSWLGLAGLALFAALAGLLTFLR
jgi:hypothetical protein